MKDPIHLRWRYGPVMVAIAAIAVGLIALGEKLCDCELPALVRQSLF